MFCIGIWRSAFIPRLARMLTLALAWIHGWSCIWFWMGNTFYAAGKYEDGGISDQLTGNEKRHTWLTAYYTETLEPSTLFSSAPSGFEVS